jgi:hypothetical protein
MARQELLFRFILRVVRRLDAVYHDVALVHAQPFHGPVVHAAAAAQPENHGGNYEEPNFHKRLLGYSNDIHIICIKWQKQTIQFLI